jgi:general secretion pathway protein H
MSTASGPTARPAATARTPTSAPGSERRRGGALTPGSARRPLRARTAHGFTLIELLVVLALIAVATAVTSLALRDPAQAQLEREAYRLTALLEVARTEARASGLAVSWRVASADEAAPTSSLGPAAPARAGGHFEFAGLPPTSQLPSRWLDPAVGAEVIGARALVLGPEPILPAQRVALRLENHRIVIATDGLGPFKVESSDTLASP